MAFIRGAPSVLLPGVVHEERATAHESLARLQAGKHFDLAILETPDNDCAQAKISTIIGNPDMCRVTFSNNGALWNRWRYPVSAGVNGQAREHGGPDQTIRIVQLGAYNEAMGGRVYRTCDPKKLGAKYAVWNRGQPDIHGFTDAHPRRVLLTDIAGQPQPGGIADREDRGRCSGLNKLPGPHLPLDHRA